MQFIREYAELFLPAKAASTQVNEESIIRRHLIPGLGKIRLTRLTTREIDLFYGRFRAKGLQVHRIHTLLHALEVPYASWKLIPSNPASNATPGPKVKRAVNTVAGLEVALLVPHP